jgi:hypothetical protein
MTCGVPTFATCHGGPGEIIKHGRSGFHIDPYHGAAAAELMADFFERAAAEPSYWSKISDAGLERIYSRYTWELYAARLMTLANVRVVMCCPVLRGVRRTNPATKNPTTRKPRQQHEAPKQQKITTPTKLGVWLLEALDRPRARRDQALP